LIALPAFAQDEPPAQGQTLPNDPALLMRLREQHNFEYRELQRVLNFINPNDTQLVENLRNRQAELARQMGDVTRQLQMLGNPVPGEMPPGMDPRMPAVGMPPGMPIPTDSIPGLTPPATRQDFSASPVTPGIIPGIQHSMPVTPTPMPVTPTPSPGMIGGMGGFPPTMPTPQNTPMDMQHIPYWGNPAQAWGDSPWGPRLPQELTGVKQSVDSLQKEIAELRETIRKLETQIQSLNRIVLLSVPERANERVIERVRENEE